jgi:hypothetical protein
VKYLFQTRNVWVRFEKKRPVWHFNTATYIGAHNIFGTNPLFSQQKQKEFELQFSPDEYSKHLPPFDDFQCADYLYLSPHFAFENTVVKVWIN